MDFCYVCVISNSSFRYSGDVNDLQRSPLPASMSSLSLNKNNDTVVVNSKPFNKTRFVVSSFGEFNFEKEKKYNFYLLQQVTVRTTSSANII